MTKKLIHILFLIVTFISFGQEKLSYQTKNETISFTKSNELIFIETTEPSTKFSKEKIINVGDNFIIIQTTENEYLKKITTLKQSFSNVEPVLIYQDGIKQICFDEIIIKTKPNVIIKDFLKGINCTIKADKFERDQYLVKLIGFDTGMTFDLINKFFNNNLLEYIEPNFIKLDVFHTNDPLFNSQWAIKNNGYLGGTVDADMDVEEAWALATGTGIKVAIIDEGVDLVHPDLQANLLSGFDTTGGNSNGGFQNNDSHGTACAGIVGAIGNNGIGGVGIAYNSKLIPVRIAKRVQGSNWTTDTWASTGINQAWQSGADVLSNSWGGGSVSLAINTAINNAVTYGRAGKGCVVLFSTGNSNTSVANPATNSQVIAVGASSQCDQRKSPTSCDGEGWGSNYGTNLDVVAPGVKIYTTDLTGTAGYELGNYTANFNGTSSACPNAAGVVALILSMKPSLTGIQARQILENNTDKVTYAYSANVAGQPNGTWNNEMGYGRVNAYKALLSIAPTINGSGQVCATPSTFTLVSATSPATWSVSPNIQIISSTGSSITVSEISNGQGTITATFQNGQTITKTIWVGAPSVNLEYYYFDPQPVKSTLCAVSSDPNITFAQQGITSVTFTGYTNYNATCIRTTDPWCVEANITNACGTTTVTYDCGFKMANTTTTAVKDDSNIFKVYPNPSNDVVNIEVRNQNNLPENGATIAGELFDMMGLSKSKVEIVNNKATFSVRGLNKGIYVLKIYINNQVESHQIAVE